MRLKLTIKHKPYIVFVCTLTLFLIVLLLHPPPVLTLEDFVIVGYSSVVLNETRVTF